MAREKPTLKVTTDPVEVEIVSEPYVVMTMRGYAPVVDVKTAAGVQVLFIGSKSLSEPIDAQVKGREGRFAGIRMRLKKESADQMAKYVVEVL